jgi:probable F420-dependent oxidoreductase
MRLGIHLPQYGRAAGPAAITAVARRAEALGFAGLWVSDHVIHPAEQTYPSPHLYDPLLTLAWAGAATERIGLGTSVLVLPQHNPLWLAKALASLDALSAGRLTVAAGVGWSEREFTALGYGFANRGRRTDEIIDILRTCWREDPASFAGEHYRFDDVRIRPSPAHEIPIWIGGRADAAFERAFRRGDGFHAIGLSLADAEPVARRVREQRPDPSFVLSVRTGWDPQGMDHGQIREELALWSEVGFQYVVAAPWRSSADEWIASMETLVEIVEPDA